MVVTTANNWMRFARIYGDNDAVLDNVQATGLLKLTQNKTPAVVRTAVESMVARRLSSPWRRSTI